MCTIIEKCHVDEVEEELIYRNKMIAMLIYRIEETVIGDNVVRCGDQI